MSAARQYCTFNLDGGCYGLEVEKVQEVLRSQPMTRVPLAPADVAGLINLRGQIVAAIDLRKRLDLPARPAASESMNIVVRTDEGTLSLLVDEIGDVVEVDEESGERVPDTLKGVARELIRCVYQLHCSLLMILDTERLVRLSSQ